MQKNHAARRGAGVEIGSSRRRCGVWRCSPLRRFRATARVAAPSVCFAAARIPLAAAPTAPPCFRRWRRSSPLPQRGSHWRVGPLPTRRRRPDMAQKGGPCLRGQRLLDNAPCQAVAGLDSGALPFPRHRASLVQTKADRHANGSPFGGTGAKRLRGQGRCQTALALR